MKDVEITSEEFLRLRELIYQKLGLFFEESKGYFISKRIAKRMEVLGVSRVDDYIFHLRFGDQGGTEMQALANLITTNETYMFREYEQLQAFSDFCLPAVLQRKHESNNRKVRIWSAGCSSGEEPYTLAIIAREVVADPEDWDFEIVATDIDENMLRMAGDAVYGSRSVEPVPPEYFDRHIMRSGSSFRIRPETRRLVEPRHLNLHDRMAMRGMRGFDFIFCRNVLIYFDDASRKSVLDHFYNALVPGGYVFLGHSESVGRITSAFTLQRLGPHLVYHK